MLFLHKLLPIFVLPIGWVVTLLGVALIRKKRWPVVAALALLYVSSLPFVGDHLLRVLESRYPQVSLVQVERADAIVSLSGIFGPPAKPGCRNCLPNLGDANERLEAGIALWQLKKAAHLVFTGGRIPWENQSEVEGAASARVAVARGVPSDNIVITGEVGNTFDEAQAVAAVARERGWSKIILVTSAFHMPRAARMFRRAGVDFFPFPVDFRVGSNGPITILDFLPQAAGLTYTELTLRDLYGMLFYSLRRR